MSSQDYLVGSQDLDVIISSDWDYSSENIGGSTGNGTSMALFEGAENDYKCYGNETVWWPEYNPGYEGNGTQGDNTTNGLFNVSDVSGTNFF